MGCMTPLSGYLKVMRELCSRAPDRRTGNNARISMADIAMSGFAVLFLQSPSFLHAQRQMLSRQGRSNAHTLFGIETIPSDNHVRKMLDGVPPGHFDPVFHHVIGTLLKKDRLKPLRRLNGHLLVALDGTEYVSSTRIECPNCSTQKQKDGTIRHYHRHGRGLHRCPGKCRALAIAAGVHHAAGRCRQAGLRKGGREALAGPCRALGGTAEADLSG